MQDHRVRGDQFFPFEPVDNKVGRLGESQATGLAPVGAAICAKAGLSTRVAAAAAVAANPTPCMKFRRSIRFTFLLLYWAYGPLLPRPSSTTGAGHEINRRTVPAAVQAISAGIIPTLKQRTRAHRRSVFDDIAAFLAAAVQSAAMNTRWRIQPLLGSASNDPPPSQGSGGSVSCLVSLLVPKPLEFHPSVVRRLTFRAWPSRCALVAKCA